MDIMNSEGGNDSQIGAVKGAALLLVIGEPFSEEHKKLILGEISKGFRCWDTEATGVDINDELAQIANKADLGEEGPNGERVIRHISDALSTEILVNPQAQTVTAAMKTFLLTASKHKHLIYSGHAFQGSGAWILQDDTFTFNNFAHVFKDQDVGNAVRQQEGSSLYIYTGSDGDWTNGHIAKNDFSKLLDVKLNPSDKLENLHGVLQFAAYLSNFVRVRQLNELLQSSDVVGNIRFSRPTLYIFPGCQGDSALFGISGFNLLVNGGYSRKACFWDFTRHLDRIDAALMTHLGTDNLYGFGSVLQRKSIENVHPEIGFMYVNASDKIKALPPTETSMPKEDTLHVNLAEEGHKLIQHAKQIGPLPQSCSRNQSGQTIEPINLYHKVGIGSLDMYILNPITDSKEMKEFYQQWNQNVSNFGSNQHMSLPNSLSVCALLVWQPSNPNDNITRIFFPGNAPQHKVLEGLEKLKSLDILKHPQCTKASLSAKPAAKKPAGLGSKPPPRIKASPVTTPKNEIPKKETKETNAPKPSTPRSKAAQAPAQRAKKEKEDVNKKTMKAPEKVGKTEKPERVIKAEKTDKVSKVGKFERVSKVEKTDKVNKAEKTDKVAKAEKFDKPKKTSTPSKGSAKSSTSSTPKDAESPKKETTMINSAPQSVPDILDTAPQLNGSQESSVDPPAFSSEYLEPVKATTEQTESLIDISPSSVPEPQSTGTLDREKMLELGIYDEDQDIEQDLNAQQAAENADERMPQMFGSMTDSMHEGLIDELPAENAMTGSFHGDGDLMTGSMHEAMFDNKRPFDEEFAQNGHSAIEEVMTPEDDTSEEIQPQALPEPIAYAPESYGKEPDVIPVVSAKEEPIATFEQDVLPASQEPDLLPAKQEAEEIHAIDEESTLPLEDGPGNLANTPDEIENTLPEDVEEKDLSEETEKEIILDEPLTKEKLSNEPDEEELEESKPVMKDDDLLGSGEQIPQNEEELEESKPVMKDDDLLGSGEQIPQNDIFVAGDLGIKGSEPSAEELISTKPEFEEKTNVNDEESNVLQNYHSGVEFENTFAESQKGLEVQSDAMAEDALVMETSKQLDDQFASGISPDLEFSGQENDPELDKVACDTPEVPDFIERPVSPEPDQQEQENVNKEPFEEESLGFQENKCDDKNDKVEAPESEEERADSPDSQLGAQDINRDSLEKDNVKELSPFSSDEQRDSIERDNEEPAADAIGVSQRDSIERSPSPEIEFEERKSNERSVSPDNERSVSPDNERLVSPDNERSVSPDNERLVSPDDEARQRQSLERSMSPEQRESTEKSFEDESEDSEDDEEEEESSSFEQEEATDEKCLIEGSLTDNQSKQLVDGKAVETDSLAAPTDSLADQQSDNLMTSESDYTDASHGGQTGYHEIDEQDGDSVEGIDEKDAFASAPIQNTNPFGNGFEQFGAPSLSSGPISNPFEMIEQQGNEKDDEDESGLPDQDVGPAGGPNMFNPLSDWGEPMGLPSPAPPEEKNETAASKKANPKTDAKKSSSDTKKNDSKRPVSATKKPATKPIASNGVPDKSKNRLSLGGTNATSSRQSGANLNSSRLSTGGKTAPKSRPSTAPAGGDLKTKMNGAKRPATATGARASPASVKMPTLPPFHPFYMDLTYIPNHGNASYSDVEFFKRVRARYYVLSALSPNTHTLDALLEGKKTWEDKSLAVTVIPTYDNETLRLWMSLHKERLAEEKVEIAPSASRCTIQLQDHETSSSAYRLEF